MLKRPYKVLLGKANDVIFRCFLIRFYFIDLVKWLGTRSLTCAGDEEYVML